MSALMTKVASPGHDTGFHAQAIAAASTGCAVLLTAGDLGPLSPMLLAFGFYTIFFALTAELVFGLRKLAACVARKRLHLPACGSQQP